MPGKFDLNSIATQNTQTACTLQLLVKPLGWGVGRGGQEGEKYGRMLRGGGPGAQEAA